MRPVVKQDFAKRERAEPKVNFGAQKLSKFWPLAEQTDATQAYNRGVLEAKPPAAG